MWSLTPWRKYDSVPSREMTADPFERQLTRFRDDFDHLLQRIWSTSPFALGGWIEQHWGLEQMETDTNYIVRMDAPGFEVDDFDLRVSGESLSVTAERKESSNGKDGSSVRYGRFERSIPLPSGAKFDEIEARYRNGVLELTIPKGEEARDVKRIAVKSG